MSEQIDPRIKAIFDEFDTNKNGKIEKSEFKPFFKDVLTKLGEAMEGEDFEQTVNEGIEIFDQNANEVLELEEFAQVINFLVQEKGYKLK